ncbi:MAG: flagellar hook assembly protein FlgD [Caulobacteraceae bacterium]
MTDAVSSALATTSSKIDASRSRLADSEETFMKLLTTQLKNQDPLSPMDSTQFIGQLVQMTSVEQQIYGNQLLENIAGQGAGTMSSAVNLIGKTVTAEGNIATLPAGGTTRWDYTLPTAATAAKLEVLDSAGRVVWSGDADKSAGTHAFNWDGKTSAGSAAPAGDYRLVVSATNSDGAAMTPITYVTGQATAIEMINGVPTVTIGKTKAPVSSVISVTNPPQDAAA